jgi:hypothetical protein
LPPILMVFVTFSRTWAADGRISGRLTDPQGEAVAGDHGEPIAMFIRVGSYLVPNNLSANR